MTLPLIANLIIPLAILVSIAYVIGREGLRQHRNSLKHFPYVPPPARAREQESHMPTIGAEDLLRDYGSPLKIAEAMLEGRLDSFEQRFVSEVVSKVVLEAARMRIEMRAAGLLLCTEHEDCRKDPALARACSQTRKTEKAR